MGLVLRLKSKTEGFVMRVVQRIPFFILALCITGMLLMTGNANAAGLVLGSNQYAFNVTEQITKADHGPLVKLNIVTLAQQGTNDSELADSAVVTLGVDQLLSVGLGLSDDRIDVWRGGIGWVSCYGSGFVSHDNHPVFTVSVITNQRFQSKGGELNRLELPHKTKTAGQWPPEQPTINGHVAGIKKDAIVNTGASFTSFDLRGSNPGAGFCQQQHQSSDSPATCQNIYDSRPVLIA